MLKTIGTIYLALLCVAVIIGFLSGLFWVIFVKTTDLFGNKTRKEREELEDFKTNFKG